MKISKSKRQLAQLLIKAGVTQFPEGANWAAQDKELCRVDFYSNRPSILAGKQQWGGSYQRNNEVLLPTLIQNWHQTVLSRDELDQIVAETAPDAEGWIEWMGGECPVDSGMLVDIKDADGFVWFARKASPVDEWSAAGAEFWSWECCDENRIIAYRLHKPELAKSTAVGDDETNLAAKEEIEALEAAESPEQRAKLARIYEPTLDQLLQDWRNADDYAQRKQAEADEAAAMRDERWQAVQDRASEFGLTIYHCGAKQEADPDPVITDWRDLQAGDEVWWSGDKTYRPGEYVVLEIEQLDYEGWSTILLNAGGETVWVNTNNEEWRFIRRP